MTPAIVACQTPSTHASRVGISGNNPPPPSESLFVANEAAGVLDVNHRVDDSNPIVTACIQTTRYVGTVDAEGFLTSAARHVEQGTLVDTLLLTVRAFIGGVDTGGLLGQDGLDVEVFLHKGTARAVSLGKLVGTFSGFWQNFVLDVPVEHVKFPTDPCPGLSPSASCGIAIEPRPNEVSFEFTGFQLPMNFTVDWLALEPKEGPELASRPVLLVHGWRGSSEAWQLGTAWPDTLQARDIAFHAVELPPDGPVHDNGAKVTQAVRDLTERFGVERVNIVAHSKGGVDSREHVRHHDDVEVLIMIGTPNAGTLLAYAGGAKQGSWAETGVRDMTPARMRQYNRLYVLNRKTDYVTAAGAYDSPSARRLAPYLGGPNDELIAVASVGALPYSTGFSYLTSVNDAISQGVCATQKLINHSCLLYLTHIVDDLFPEYMTLPFAAVPAGERAGRRLAAAAPGVAAGGEAEEPQIVASAVGVVAAGVTDAVPVVVDPMPTAMFLMQGDPVALRLVLVSPTGSRIDASTPQADPAVVHASFGDLGPLSFTSFDVQEPETGTWTLEVTGTGDPAAEGHTYAVSVMTPLVPDVGVVLDARIEETVSAAGQPVTIVATITQDGAPVTDATLQAVVIHPDGRTRTEITFRDDGTEGDATAGDGVYTGLVLDTAVAGRYDVAVSAARSEPAFTREQVLQVTVAQGGSTFSGMVTDHGADTDGDGLFDQLVVDVGVSVDTTAEYRLYGTLTEAGSEATIEQVRIETPLEPGLRSVPLAFDGARLSELGLDGPYVVADLALEEVETATVVAQSPPHTTAAYAHTQFQRPACVATGNTSDHGANAADMPQVPFEELVIEVEVDLLAAAQVRALARLHGAGGALIDVDDVFTHLPSGRSMLAFRIQASKIRRVGLPGPYTLQQLTLTGTTEAAPGSPTPGTPVSLNIPGVVAITQPYTVEDFAESPRFTVGGTVTGLVGRGLTLRDVLSRTGSEPRVDRNGPFTLRRFPDAVSGNSYDVQVKTQPSNPAQVCFVVNGSGTIGTANVTDVEVQCLPPAAAAGT